MYLGKLLFVALAGCGQVLAQDAAEQKAKSDLVFLWFTTDSVYRLNS